MEYTLKELLAASLAHTFRDGEVGFTGLATGKAAADYISNIPLMGMQLARKTHAPNLTILLCGWSINPDFTGLDFLPDSEYEEKLQNLPCEAQMIDWPGPWGHRRGEVSFAFGSGVQVDKEGNINSTCIGDYRHPKVQLVGPIFLPEHMSVFGREYIMMPKHEKRTFVEKVDYVSGVGYPGGMEGRRKLQLEGGGPKYIYTPRCIFSFDEEGKIFVKSIHPGVTPDEVIENTGFDVGDLSNVPVTPEPTEEELRIMREEIDPNRLFLN